MFQNFIILGLIPGTHVQINFTDWIVVASVIGLFISMWPLIRFYMVRFMIRHQLTFIVQALLTEVHQAA
ncbi:MAG TPA: hypothetical protein VMQ52_02110 [Candidatus Saccharimonadales bacterium]|jgi:hypothetical protein|nr:hypothetical protein [Candidatus Saccharimonadales bacterium]